MGNEADVIAGIDKIGNEQQPPVPQTPAAVAVASAFVDEDAELARLEGLAQAEAAGTGTPAPSAAAPAAPAEPVKPAAPASTAAPAAEPAQPAATAPVKQSEKEASLTRALIAERRGRQQATAAANHLAGQVRVLTAVATKEGVLDDAALQAAGLKAPEPEKTPAQKIADVDAAIIQLAQDYEDGKDGLTAPEWKKQELELLRKKDELRASVQQPAAAPVQDLGLEEHLDTLMTTYPVLAKLNEQQVAPLEALAYQQAEAEGKPIQAGALGTKDLRERIGRLATQFYPSQPAPAAPGAPQAPAGGDPLKLSPEAQQRKDKLELQSAHPPNISGLGAAAPGGQVSEEQMLATLQSFGGDDEAAIRWIQGNQGAVSTVMRGVNA